MANEVLMEVLAGLRAAAEGLNVAVEDELHGAVADGLLAAAVALSAAGDLLQGDVASSLRVAGTGLRYSAKSLRKVTSSHCGLVHSDCDSFAWDDGYDMFDCRVIFHDSASRKHWLKKNGVVEDSEDESDSAADKTAK